MVFLSILHLGISRTTRYYYGWLFHYLRLKYYDIIFKEFNFHKTRNTYRMKLLNGFLIRNI